MGNKKKILIIYVFRGKFLFSSFSHIDCVCVCSVQCVQSVCRVCADVHVILCAISPAIKEKKDVEIMQDGSELLQTGWETRFYRYWLSISLKQSTNMKISKNVLEWF